MPEDKIIPEHSAGEILRRQDRSHEAGTTAESPIPAVQAAETGERQQETNKADPFPPEGTDEKAVKPGPDKDEGLSQDVRLAATRAWLAAEREKMRKS